jgi:hypothetical protein
MAVTKWDGSFPQALLGALWRSMIGHLGRREGLATDVARICTYISGLGGGEGSSLDCKHTIDRPTDRPTGCSSLIESSSPALISWKNKMKMMGRGRGDRYDQNKSTGRWNWS